MIHRKHPLFELYKPVLDGSVQASLRFVGQLPEHSEDYDDKAVVNPWLASTDEIGTLANGFPKSLVLSQEATVTQEGFDDGMKQIKEKLGLPCVLKVSRGYRETSLSLTMTLAAYQRARLPWSGCSQRRARTVRSLR